MVWYLSNEVPYLHIQHNRRVRMVGLAGIYFTTSEIRRILSNRKRVINIYDLTR